MNATKIDLENWNRKNQYDFFIGFDQPFFNVALQLKLIMPVAVIFVIVQYFIKNEQYQVGQSSLFSCVKGSMVLIANISLNPHNIDTFFAQNFNSFLHFFQKEKNERCHPVVELSQIRSSSIPS